MGEELLNKRSDGMRMRAPRSRKQSGSETLPTESERVEVSASNFEAVTPELRADRIP
jgi:hypothetical protein